LLADCLLLVALGFLMVLGSGQAAGRRLGLLDLLPLLTYAASLLVIHLTLVLFRFRGDQMLPVVAAFLSGLWLLVQYQMGAFEGADCWANVRFIFPGGALVMLVVCVAGMRGRYRRLAAWSWVWAGLSLILLAGVLVTGQRFRCAVYATGFITPTGLLKITVILFLAGLIDRDAKTLGNWRYPWLISPFKKLLPLLDSGPCWRDYCCCSGIWGCSSSSAPPFWSCWLPALPAGVIWSTVFSPRREWAT